MTRSQWPKRIFRTLLWLAPGMALLGTSCGLAVRDSVISAGAGFVGSAFTTILQQLIPVEDIVGGGGEIA